MARTNVALRRQLTRDPDGAVGRDLRRRGLRVQNRGRTLAPVKDGHLRNSITTTDPRPHPLGQVVGIGSNLRYSRAVHNGSGSSDAPRSWRIAHSRGHVIPARPYLVNALPAASG